MSNIRVRIFPHGTQHGKAQSHHCDGTIKSNRFCYESKETSQFVCWSTKLVFSVEITDELASLVADRTAARRMGDLYIRQELTRVNRRELEFVDEAGNKRKTLDGTWMTKRDEFFKVEVNGREGKCTPDIHFERIDRCTEGCRLTSENGSDLTLVFLWWEMDADQPGRGVGSVSAPYITRAVVPAGSAGSIGQGAPRGHKPAETPESYAYNLEWESVDDLLSGGDDDSSEYANSYSYSQQIDHCPCKLPLDEGPPPVEGEAPTTPGGETGRGPTTPGGEVGHDRSVTPRGHDEPVTASDGDFSALHSPESAVLAANLRAEIGVARVSQSPLGDSDRVSSVVTADAWREVAGIEFLHADE